LSIAQYYFVHATDGENRTTHIAETFDKRADALYAVFTLVFIYVNLNIYYTTLRVRKQVRLGNGM
jgi:hypothetical protein